MAEHGGDWEGHVMGAALMLPYATVAGQRIIQCEADILQDELCFPRSCTGILTPPRVKTEGQNRRPMAVAKWTIYYHTKRCAEKSAIVWGQSHAICFAHVLGYVQLIATQFQMTISRSFIVRWRSDGRCGENFPLKGGSPSECDPKSERPCCSDYGFCGASSSHCTCRSCRDYRSSSDLCYMKLNSTEGFFKSPNYPDPYPNNADCRIDISRSSDNQCGIKLFLEDFDVESEPGEMFCQKDWLAIESCVPEGGAKICGNETGVTHQYVYQPGALSIRLHFHSDGNGTRKGFKIKYQIIESCKGLFLDTEASVIPGSGGALCQTKIQDYSGTINTPYHPKKYPENLDCVYEFKRLNPFICGIKMRTQQFELEPALQTSFGGACSDFFHTPSCGFLCGKLDFSWVAKFQPGATSLRFHFHSDESSGFSGFLISFEQIYQCS